MQSLTLANPTAVSVQLERILRSTQFSKSNRSQRFLRYVVDNSWEDRNESLKEYAIAIHVFDRDASYDPAVDATVRVEAGRLRARLRDYYADAGQNDQLVIEIPKGAYHASITERCPKVDREPALVNTAVQGVKTFSVPDAAQGIGSRPNYLGLVATVVFAAVVGGAIFFRGRYVQ